MDELGGIMVEEQGEKQDEKSFERMEDEHCEEMGLALGRKIGEKH